MDLKLKGDQATNVKRQLLQTLPDLHITLLEKETFAPTACARDLGVQVDAALSYNEHVTNITSTCMGSLCQINRIKYLLDSRTLENVITALAFSKLYVFFVQLFGLILARPMCGS